MAEDAGKACADLQVPGVVARTRPARLRGRDVWKSWSVGSRAALAWASSSRLMERPAGVGHVKKALQNQPEELPPHLHPDLV